MTPFNHLKYHFTRGISIPSSVTEKTKTHQVSIHRLAAGNVPHKELLLSRENVYGCFGVKQLNGNRWKNCEFITVKSRLSLTAPINKAWVSLHWFMMCCCINNASFGDPLSRNKLKSQFSTCLIFQCQNYLLGSFFQSVLSDHPL